MAKQRAPSSVRVALLTAGRDKPYAYGMATALMAREMPLDIIGGNDLVELRWQDRPQAKFLNLRGDMRESASLSAKVIRVLVYYVRLLLYAATTESHVFHILWNNKIETFDRVPLMLYYRLLGKQIVLTVHNVNSRTRDANDTWFNRLTLGIQYRLADHLFVHTERMKSELAEQFNVDYSKVTVIPFGINNAVPNTALSPADAKRRLGIERYERAILFFGNIAPYKGLEYLIAAFQELLKRHLDYRLIIAGKPKSCDAYWKSIAGTLQHPDVQQRVVQKLEYIPDEETEVYFKAADVLVLPYRSIYQSGVLFLAYGFGLPVIASNVGGLQDEIIEGRTGFLCRPEDFGDLARAIEQYFASSLYRDLSDHRRLICEHARQRYSWDLVGNLTTGVYWKLDNDSTRCPRWSKR